MMVLVLSAGCAAEPPKPDIPLPPDELIEVVVYKNIKDVCKHNHQIEAIVAEPGNKRLQYLNSGKDYDVVVDAAEEPWWEETRTRVYAWRYYNGRWRMFSRHELRTTIHVSNLSQIRGLP